MTGPIARRWIFAVASAWIGGALAAGVAGAQDADSLGLPPIADYSSGSDYLPQSPSVSGGAVGAFANPASWATSGRVESAFWWDDRSVRRDYLDNWGLSIGKTLGFAMRQETIALPGGPATVRDHQIGLAFGDRRGHFGFAYRWPGGDTDEIPREKAIAVGAITRPNRWVSHGLSGVFSVESDARLGVFDIGVRPLGSPLLTLFGDYSLRDDQTLEEGFWGAGVEMRPWHGLHVGAKVREAEGDDDLSYTLNLGLTFDDGGFHVLPGYDEDGDRGRTTYLLRQGVPYRGIPVRRQLESRFAKPRYYVPLDLEKKWITYQKNVWFDDNRIAWLDLARQLDRWKADPRVRGIAVNTSGLRISNSLVWEFRQQLAGMREAGKEVVVYGDRFGLMTYYLASAADRIVIDPQGEITLVGLAAHRTYWRGFLDKVGLGIEEWRFFTYKSAMETFARRDMSEPDREQIQRLIDVIYETGREDICRSRGITHEDFDSIVENDLYLPATLAIERKLADEAGRWHDLEDWLKEERKGARLGAPNAEPDPSELPDERWGKPREIQVVYAIGECAMDSGIRGRATSKHMRRRAARRFTRRRSAPERPRRRSDTEDQGCEEAGHREPGRRRRIGRLLDQPRRHEDPDDAVHDHRFDRRHRRLGVGRRHQRKDRLHGRRRAARLARRPADGHPVPDRERPGRRRPAGAKSRREGEGDREGADRRALRRFREGGRAGPEHPGIARARDRRGSRLDGRRRDRTRPRGPLRRPDRRDRRGEERGGSRAGRGGAHHRVSEAPPLRVAAPRAVVPYRRSRDREGIRERDRTR